MGKRLVDKYGVFITFHDNHPLYNYYNEIERKKYPEKKKETRKR